MPAGLHGKVAGLWAELRIPRSDCVVAEDMLCHIHPDLRLFE